MQTDDADGAAPVPMTCDRVRKVLRRLDATIALVEGRTGTMEVQAFRAYMAMRQRRLSLRLLLVARRVEVRKKIVSLDRWRYGYQMPDSVDATLPPHPPRSRARQN